MDDPNIQVKDSAAWTLGRVCEHVPEAVLNEQYLLPLLKALVGGLKGEPRVATNVCWVCLFCGLYKVYTYMIFNYLLACPLTPSFPPSPRL